MIVPVPTTAAVFDAYLRRAVPDYAQDKVASGQWSADASLDLSRRAYADLLPQGMQTPEHVFLTLREDSTNEDVGMLWYGVQERAGERIAYVYDVFVESPCRRRGFATLAFRALETEVAFRGLAAIALHVFGHNAAARALYDSLGYRATNIDMFKRIEGGDVAQS